MNYDFRIIVPLFFSNKLKELYFYEFLYRYLLNFIFNTKPGWPVGGTYNLFLCPKMTFMTCKNKQLILYLGVMVSILVNKLFHLITPYATANIKRECIYGESTIAIAKKKKMLLSKPVCVPV